MGGGLRAKVSNQILESLSRKPFAVIGHRGAAGTKPENTLSSIKYAIENGADIVEVDVRMTRDEVLVLVHDDTLERLAGIPQSVRSLDYRWIRDNIRIDGEPIATLEDALRFIDGRTGLFVDVKEPDTIDRILDLIKLYGVVKWVGVVSLYEEPLRYARENLPGIVTGITYIRSPRRIADAYKIGAKIVLPYYRFATGEVIYSAHKLGLKVVAWTVNNVSDALELTRRGVDGITTDYPERLARLRDKYWYQSRALVYTPPPAI